MKFIKIVFADTPNVEIFGIEGSKNRLVQVAWLENKIYAIHSNIKRVRVFSDRSPFSELPEGIEIKGLGDPFGLVAHSANRSFFISDMKNFCIWKIQMPNRAVIRWETQGGSPRSLSITPDMDLLAVVKFCGPVSHKRKNGDDNEDAAEAEGEENDDEDAENFSIFIIVLFYDDDDEEDDDGDYLTLQVFRLTDGSQTRSMRLPQDIQCVSCAAELPNKSFVILYPKNIGEDNTIGVLSMDGEDLILTRTLVLDSFESIQDKRWNPFYFIVEKDGGIFVTDYNDGRVIWFDSKLTDYRIISSNGHQLINATSFAYIQEKQQLLLCGEASGHGLTTSSVASVFHLSPCSLSKERSEAGPHELVRRRRAHDLTSNSMKRKYSDAFDGP